MILFLAGIVLLITILTSIIEELAGCVRLMQDQFANIIDKKSLLDVLPQIEAHGLIVSKSKAAQLLGTSRNTFDKDFVETNFIEPLPLRSKDKFSLIDVLTIPEKIKQRSRLNAERITKQVPKGNRTIDQIFSDCEKIILKNNRGAK